MRLAAFRLFGKKKKPERLLDHIGLLIGVPPESCSMLLEVSYRGKCGRCGPQQG